jgi:hypothetical protein
MQRSSAITARRLKKAERGMDFFSITDVCRMLRTPIVAAHKFFGTTLRLAHDKIPNLLLARTLIVTAVKPP